ncbi:MAG: TylF/MycF/NovP-related O-methyltransferase [Solirubrobacteraceae bacterium]|nr:TylF/MycF/NovP-related O-methyltransferase [Solirubrobacteraceae bacterium]
MDEPFTKIAGHATDEELALRHGFVDLFRACPIPDDELLANLGLFLKRQDLARTIFLIDLYRQIVDVPGVVLELGVRWGRDLVLLQALRGILEPYNYSRRVVGFDTFEGFPSVDARDGTSEHATVGAYDVTDGYEDYLAAVLDYHEGESPLAHIRKHELVKGDVTRTLDGYLADHPETIVAFAYFDLDLFEPTRHCLAALRGRLTRGSIVAFDELCCPDFPGETAAVAEVVGLDSVRLRRSPMVPFPSYFVVE